MGGMMPLGMPLDPMFGVPQGNIHQDCDRRLAMMAESIEREKATIQVLESKCEEYLSQLQRSADIIEMSREREDRDRQRFIDREEELESKLEEERNRRQDAEDERDKLRRDIDRLRHDRGEGEGETERIKETLYKRDLTLNEQKVRIG